MAQAIATSAYRKAKTHSSSSHETTILGRHLPTLEKMLWGGTVVLLVDHAIHGELFTFSLRELLTVGLPMSVILTAVWALYAVVKERRGKVTTAKIQ
ncbi:MAG: hypothetical protein IKX34_00015 [Bacteroidales bacterium]|nr:hypothetical protein [Bacteroidales bacterium]